jgi:hypothetical protein
MVLACIIHERFCCNRRSAVATSLRPAGSPLEPSTYCTSTPRVLTAPRAGLTTRLSDFGTNRHESCGLDFSVCRYSYVEDCEVCCNPLEISYTVEDGALAQFEAKCLE